MSNVICLVNPQNGNWVLFTIARNSLYQDTLYQGLSVPTFKSNYVCMLLLIPKIKTF